MSNGELFVGRTEETARFETILHDALNPPPEEDLPYVVHIRGTGGIGKTALAKQLATRAGRYEPPYQVWWIDWADEAQKNPAFQAGLEKLDLRSVLDVLHLRAAQFEHSKPMQAYAKVIKQDAETQQQISQALVSLPEGQMAEMDALRMASANAIAQIIRSRVPIIGSTGEELVELFLDQGIRVGVDKARQISKMLETQLRARLNPDHYEHLLNYEQQLTHALAAGIRQIAERQPLLIALDSYEIVDRADVWLREVYKLAGPHVVWLIAGRNNLLHSRQFGLSYFKGYDQDFPRRLIDMDLRRLALDDIRAFFASRVPERPLTAEALQVINEITFGIPLAVAEAADVWSRGVPLDEIRGDRQESESSTQVTRAMTARLMRYVSDADRYALYALVLAAGDVWVLDAMLRPEGDDAFDLGRRLRQLERNYHSVHVSQARLHDIAQLFIREHLRQPLQRRDQTVRLLNEKAVAVYRERKAKLETELKTIEDRYAEETWRNCVLSLLEHLCWLEKDQGLPFYFQHMIEAEIYHPDFGYALHRIIRLWDEHWGEEDQEMLADMGGAFHANRLSTQHFAILDKVVRRGWLKGDGEAERLAIISYWRGLWLARDGHTESALGALEAARARAAGDVLRDRIEHALADVAAGRLPIAAEPVTEEPVVDPAPESAAEPPPQRPAAEPPAPAAEVQPDPASADADTPPARGARTPFSLLADAAVGAYAGLEAADRESAEDAATTARAGTGPEPSAPTAADESTDESAAPAAGAPTARTPGIGATLPPELAAAIPSFDAPPRRVAAAGARPRPAAEPPAPVDELTLLRRDVAQEPTPQNLIALGDAYRRQRDYGDALEMYHDAIALAGTPLPKALKAIGAVYSDLGLVDDALAVCTRAAQNAPDDAQLNVQLGELYTRQAAWDRAEHHFQHALQQLPLADAYRGLGDLHFARGDYDQAYNHFRRAEKMGQRVSPDRLGETLLAAGHYREAQSVYEAALKETDTPERFEEKLGDIQAARQAWARALNIYQRLPLSRVAHKLGFVLHKLGAHEESLKAYEAAIKHNIMRGDDYLNYADALRRLGRLPEAAAAYRSGFSRDADDPSLLREWSLLEYDLDEPDVAEQALSRAIQAYPNDPALQARLADLALRTGRTAEARAFADAATAAASAAGIAEPLAARVLGDLAHDEGRYADAQALYAQAQADGVTPSAERLAHTLMQQDRLAEALQLYADLPEAQRTRDNWLSQAEIERRLGEYDAAVSHYEHVLRETPRDLTALRGLAAAHAGRNDHAAAANAYERLLQIDVEQPVYRALARSYLAQGDATAAIASYARAVQLNPAEPENWLSLADAARQNDDVERAVIAYDNVLALDANHRAAREAQAELAEARGAWKAAALHLNALRRQGDADQALLLRLARAYREDGQPDLALAVYEDAFIATPRSLAVLLNVGALRAQLGRAAGALQAYEAAVALEPESAEAYIGMANVLADQNAFDEARGYYHLALSYLKGPQQADVWRHLGKLALRTSQPGQAVEMYGNVTERNADDWRHLALAYRTLGSPAEAVTAYQNALVTERHDPGTWRGLAELARQTGDHAQAVEAFEESLRLRPRQPLYADLAASYTALGRPKQAQVAFARAVRHFPESAADWLGLAQTAQLNHDTKTARQAYERVLQLDAGHVAARRGLGAVAADEADWAEVIVQGEALQQQDALQAADALRLGHAYRALEQPEAAIQMYQQVLAEDDAMPEALFWLAELRAQQGRPAAAQRAYEAVLRQTPDDIPARHGLARVLSAQGETEAALTTYRALLPLVPLTEQDTLWRAIGTLSLQVGRPDDTLEALHQVRRFGIDDWLTLADAERALEDYPAALESYGQILTRQPDHHGALVGQAAAYAGQGNYPKAVATYERALNQAPSAALYAQLAQTYIDAGNPHQAQVVMEQAVTHDDTSVDGWLELAGIARRNGDVVRAAAAYDRALALAPDNPAALRPRAEIARGAGAWDEAIRFLEPLVSAPDVTVETLMQLGDAYQRDGQSRSALRIYEQALAREPENLAVLLETGSLRGQFGYLEQALEAYEAALALEPDSVTALTQSAEILARLGRTHAAEARFQQVLPHISLESQATIWQRMGDLALENGQAEAAVDAYRKSRDLIDTAGSAVALGTAYLAAKRARDAIVLFSELAAREPDNPAVFIGLGDTYLELEEGVAAEKAYRKALALDYKNADTWSKLGHIYLERHDYDQALKALRAAIQYDPNLAPAQFGLGRVYYARGKYGEATQAFRAAIASGQRTFPETHVGLALAYAKIGAYDDAQDAISEAVSLEPRAEWLALQGDIAVQQGTLDLALRAYGEALTSDEETPGLLVKYGHVAMQAERFKDAEIILLRAIKVERSAEAHTLLGDLYAMNRGLPDAQLEYRRALDLDADYVPAYVGLGETHYLMGRDQWAIQAFQNALRLDENNRQALIGLGHIHRDRLEWEQSQRMYERARELEEDAIIYGAFGDLYFRKGALDEAKHAYEEAIARDPLDLTSLGALATLHHRLGDLDHWHDYIARMRPLVYASDTGLYNRACFEAISGNSEVAVRLLREAVNAGEVDLDWVKGDPDLEMLRDDPRFRLLLARLESE